MVSLTPEFAFPAHTETAQLIQHAIMPHGRDHGQAFALMIGVKRNVNPRLRLAGDSLGQADIVAVENLCSEYSDNKFLCTMLSRENQHELCVAARKFRNLHVFGCWWFLNNPSIIEEITRMRLELIGLSMTPQHSDCRVLDQLVYKWQHSRGHPRESAGRQIRGPRGDRLGAHPRGNRARRARPLRRRAGALPAQLEQQEERSTKDTKKHERSDFEASLLLRVFTPDAI
ncbi:MAG: hypothetical protein WDN28_18260 [Chthoniobacter sp.]